MMDFKFSELCTLLETIECIDKKTDPSSQTPKQKSINDWFDKNRGLLLAPPGDQAIVALSCLFPELRPDRVYGLVKSEFARSVTKALAMTGTYREKKLVGRMANNEELAAAVADTVALAEHSRPRKESAVTVLEVDRLCMALASRCMFSGPNIYTASRYRDGESVPVSELLRPILGRLQSYEIKWLIRMIEKDMRPAILPVRMCLQALHFALPSLMTFHSDMAVAVKVLFKEPYDAFLPLPAPNMEKLPQYINGVLSWLKPTVGVPVRIPSCYKARKFSDVQRECNFDISFVETKYDGERMQIHLSLNPPFIKIFSKSGRESTNDRTGIHEAIKKTLRILEYADESSPAGFQKSVILEAELLVFDEQEKRIAEFHRISDHVYRAGIRINAANDPSRSHEHLMAVFFDVLCVDSTSLLSQPYEYRRSVLESLVTEIPGISMLAQRQSVNLKDLDALKQVFNSIVGQGEEGIVVKRASGTYIGASMGQKHQQWVKVKRDYIAGIGDTADFAIVGGGIDTLRLKERKLDSGCFTTFFVGCLRNKEAVKRFSARPTFDALFCVTYGLDKQKLARINQLVRDFSKPYNCKNAIPEYDLHIYQYVGCAMKVYFPNPLIFEILCAGFDKPAGNNFYVMRWPRVVKVHFDRDWIEGTSFDELQKMAKLSLQHRPKFKSDYSPPSVPATNEIHRRWKSAKDLPMLDLDAILPSKPNRALTSHPVLNAAQLAESASIHAATAEPMMDARTAEVTRPTAPVCKKVFQDSSDLEKLRLLLNECSLLVSKSLNSRRQIGKLFQRFTGRKELWLEPVCTTSDILEANIETVPNPSKSTLAVLIVEGRKPRASHQDITRSRSLISARYSVRDRETRTDMNLSHISLQAKNGVASLLVIDWRILLTVSASSRPIDLSSHFILHDSYC
ncbi:ATP dependent DNA ligase domain-containing protein [Lipomyces kononenkoae]|uniref:ATP dependent DNA ligase domain-containing protein n=1 Tax=Lipomyces kononenkoae TaxID=34357 RepID=A0ACC3SYH2_LIPKO